MRTECFPVLMWGGVVRGTVLYYFTIPKWELPKPKKSELSRNLAAVPKLLLWTSWSINTISLTANLVCLPIKTEGEMSQRLTFPSLRL